MATLKPTRDHILVQRKTADEKSSGGIILPDTAKDKPLEGKVISVGPGKRSDDGQYITPSVQVGDHILFGKYAGNEITMNGEELLVIREEDVIAVFEEA